MLTVTRNIRDLVGAHAVTTDSGARVYELLAHDLARGDTVILDFAGVKLLSETFLSAALCPLRRCFAQDELEDLIGLQNVPHAWRHAVADALGLRGPLVLAASPAIDSLLTGAL